MNPDNAGPDDVSYGDDGTPYVMVRACICWLDLLWFIR